MIVLLFGDRCGAQVELQTNIIAINRIAINIIAIITINRIAINRIAIHRIAIITWVFLRERFSSGVRGGNM